FQEYEETLKHYRKLAEQNPETFLPNVANALLSLSVFYLQVVPDTAKSVIYAQEARDILIPLCEQAPHLQGELDRAESLLEAISTKPGE
ncbi:hypothetical protein VU04_09555, partial [Desulfobulbus sp. TB]|nr:hypothetical protein [Desulfobulbus sp. TB]